MKPDWDKLMDEFKDSKTSLVADVDCTTEGKGLCDKVGVKGYPSIKYGDPNDLKDYQGGRDFEQLKTFADENLGPTCSPENLDLCDEASKEQIAKFQAMNDEELEKAIADYDAKVKKIESKADKTIGGFQGKIKDLQNKIEAENKKKDGLVKKEEKKSGLRMMRAVASKKKKEEL